MTKMLRQFLWILFLFGCAKSIFGSSFQNRIGKGLPTPSNFINFTVHITNTGLWCTATIISKRHMLTASHCLPYMNVESYKKYKIVFGGMTYKPSLTESYISTYAYVPLEYHSFYLTDIAILEFPNGTDLSYDPDGYYRNIPPVTLAKDYVEKEGDIVTIAGYGKVWNGLETSQVPCCDLLHLNVSINIGGFGGLLILAGDKMHRTLHGDSGGPLLIYRNDKWYQIGDSAWTGNYAYSARMSSFCDFVEEVTKKEVQCESMYPERPAIPSFPPIYNGEKTPKEVFDFVIPLHSYSFTGNQQRFGCTATVISPRHLLTSANCVYKKGNPAATDYPFSKAVNHTFFADCRSKSIQRINELINGIAYFPKDYYHYLDYQNIAVVEFPEGTDVGIEPVALAKDYHQVYHEELIIAGYGNYTIGNKLNIDEISPPLKHIKVESVILEEFYERTNRQFYIKTSALTVDEGGPALIEKNGKFYQIGISTHASDKKDLRIRITFYCDFIANVTQNEVECESIYEPKLKPTTTLPPPSQIQNGKSPDETVTNQQMTENSNAAQISLTTVSLTMLCIIYCKQFLDFYL